MNAQARHDAVRLGAYLRNDVDPDLEARRTVLKLSLFSAAMMGWIALYQTGIIRRLPGRSGTWLDSQKVSASPEAYSMLHTPDALLGVVSYAITAAIAAAGGKNRSSSMPWIPVGLAAKATADAAYALTLTRNEITRQRTLCVPCLATTLATLHVLPLAFTEIRQMVRSSNFRTRLSP
jgi:uncharacterized membrane protein